MIVCTQRTVKLLFKNFRSGTEEIAEKNGHYNKTDIDIIRNLNKSYYNLELAVGVELDSY
ncbi:MAG: hypothetical protein LBN19_00245 [Endomicrobium sp.]|jgi:hypothetical protein|nr:hypothetical protein [Endomicrobium sp.]